MTILERPCATTIALAAILAGVPAAPRAAAGPLLRTAYVPGEVLVEFTGAATVEDLRSTISSHGHVRVADLRPRWSRVAIRPGEAVEEAIAAYARDRAVASVQPNYVYRLAAAPDDPQFGQLWAFGNTGQTVTSIVQGGGSMYTTHNPGTAGADIGVQKAWDHITDCSAVTVAVVDSGVNTAQQDLAPNMWDGGAAYPLHGFDFVDGDPDPTDLNGHGTHVAGIIGASGNDAVGSTGVCWKASLMAVRVMDAAGQGTTATIVQGVDFAVSHGAQVVNMSLGGSGSYDPLFADAIARAQDAGVVVVVAAGNDGSNDDATPVYPCSFPQPNLVCVAALDQAYELASFSNWGATSVDVGAPGTNVLSTWAGTSESIADPLTGWTGSSTTGGGWAQATNGGRLYLVDPATYPNGRYANNTDDRVRKTFDVAGADVAVLSFYAAANVRSGDFFRVACSSAGGDPFAVGTVVGEATGVATYPLVLPADVDVSSCIGATCSIGFQLQSGTSGGDRGVAVTEVALNTLALDATSFNTASGTSMAAPMVAGLAAMLRAYNPQYTYADVVSAIAGGGRPVASLAGKTTTGKAIDVMGSLAYLHPPTGLSATVH